MSSDEDTPSLEKDKKDDKIATPTSVKSLKCKFRFLRNKMKHVEGNVNVKDLSKLCNINSEENEQVFPEDSEIESAIDALEDVNMKNDISDNNLNDNEVLERLLQDYDNIKLDDQNVVSINEITGKEIKETFYNCNIHQSKTIFAPTGFVDLRHMTTNSQHFSHYL